MINQAGGTSALNEGMARLADEIAELGMLAMDAFKYAAEALFGPDAELVRSALDAASASSNVAIVIHQKTIEILARWSPTGPDLKRLMELQRTSTEYARIAANARRTAEQLSALPYSAESQLARLDANAPQYLAGLVQQVYIGLRGCLLLVASGDRGLARRIIAENSELERLHMLLQLTTDRAIARQPQHARAWQSLAVALSALRHIGDCVVAICEDHMR